MLLHLPHEFETNLCFGRNRNFLKFNAEIGYFDWWNSVQGRAVKNHAVLGRLLPLWEKKTTVWMLKETIKQDGEGCKKQ